MVLKNAILYLNQQRVSTLLISFLLIPLLSFSQFSFLNTENKANEAFKSKEYFKALELYNSMSTKEKYIDSKHEIKVLKGLCYKAIGGVKNLKRAKLILNPSRNKRFKIDLLYLEYAHTLHLLSELDSALTYYQKYLLIDPTEDRAIMGITSCEFALEQIKNPSDYSVYTFRHNSKYNDFSPTFASANFDVLLFTSSREGSLGSGVDPFNGDSYTDIYSVNRDRKGRWTKPIPFADPMNTKGHEAGVSVSNNGSQMYFTRREVSTKNNRKPSYEIFYSEMNGKSWTLPVKINIYSNDTFDMVSPFFYENKLYFSSNMSGGYGGYDLWFIELYENENSDPINLGMKVNTSQNEFYPFFHSDGSFYFSSDGHVGMGGLDIFKVDFDGDNNIKSLVNLSSPINSTGNDFGIIFENINEKGFLSSDRLGSKGIDLYHFSLPLE